MQRLVQDPLALEILEGRVLPGSMVRVDADAAAGKMKFELSGTPALGEDAEPAVAAARPKARR